MTWQLRPQPPMFERFLLVEFSHFPGCTQEELEQAWQDFTTGLSDRYWDLRKALRQCTIRVGLVGQYEEWSPQDREL